MAVTHKLTRAGSTIYCEVVDENRILGFPIKDVSCFTLQDKCYIRLGIDSIATSVYNKSVDEILISGVQPVSAADFRAKMAVLLLIAAGGGGGGAGTVTTANNGLSSPDGGTTVVLGQDNGEAGNPAAFSNDREVPLNGHTLILTANSNTKGIKIVGSIADVINGLEVANNSANAAAVSKILLTGNAGGSFELGVNSGGAGGGNAKRRFINSGAEKLVIGDSEGVSNGVKITFNQSAKEAVFDGNFNIVAKEVSTPCLYVVMPAGHSAYPIDVSNSAFTRIFGVWNTGQVVSGVGYSIIGTDSLFTYVGGYTSVYAGGNFGIRFYNNAGTHPFNFEFMSNNDANAFADLNIIRTLDPGAGRGKWKLGQIHVDAGQTFDDGRWIELEIDGENVRIAVLVNP